MGDEWYTPQSVFERLGLTFDLDVCAPIGGARNVPAVKSYSIEDDGLVQPWFGIVWMNPPYSNPTPWIERWLEHGNGLALVPMSKSKWTRRLWESDATVALLETNLKFDRPNDKPGQIFMQCWLWALGDTAKAALGQSNISCTR